MTRQVPDAEKHRRGTAKPSRSVVMLFPDHASQPDPADIPPPKHLSAAAKRIWSEKVDRYRQRGQKVEGFESTLGVYCEIEAALNAATRRGTVTAAMITTYRRFAADFYDTPASQHATPGAGGGKRVENPYRRNGLRPSEDT
jgi:hypothetical protein